MKLTHHGTVDSDGVSVPEAELQLHASVGRVLSGVVVIHCCHPLHNKEVTAACETREERGEGKLGAGS